MLGYQTIDEAMQDALVVAQLKSVLQETGKLLVVKWNFDEQEHAAYIEKLFNVSKINIFQMLLHV